MKTMHLGPKDVLVGLEVHLENDLDTDEIEQLIDKIETEIMKIIPESKKDFIYVEVQS